jgi:hypothetical protein
MTRGAPRPPGRMHADEIVVAEAQVRALLAAQAPALARLPLAAVAQPGTDNAMFRLGDAFVVRLPRIGWAHEGARREQRWPPGHGRGAARSRRRSSSSPIYRNSYPRLAATARHVIREVLAETEV